MEPKDVYKVAQDYARNRYPWNGDDPEYIIYARAIAIDAFLKGFELSEQVQ